LHRAVVAMALAAGVCVRAEAAGAGNVVIGAGPQLLGQTYAFSHHGGLLEPGSVTTVIFSDKPIDSAKVKAQFRKMNNTDLLVDDASASTLTIDFNPAGELTGAKAKAAGKSLSELTYSLYESRLSRNEPTHIAGYVRSGADAAERDRDNDSYLDLKFDIDVDGALKP